MCSKLPTTLRSSINLSKQIGFKQQSNCLKGFRVYSTAPETQWDYTDMSNFYVLLDRVRWNDPGNPRFRLTRDSEEFRFENVSLAACPNLVRTDSRVVPREESQLLSTLRTLWAAWQWFKVKLLVLGLEEQLPPPSDLATGSRQIHKQVLRALANNDLSSFSHNILGGNETLKELRRQSNQLTGKQKDVFKNLTDDDFIGVDGCMYNWNGYNFDVGNVSRYIHFPTVTQVDATGEKLDRPVFKYSIYMASLVGKKKLYKLVRSFRRPSMSDEPMRVRMPPNYGYKRPVMCFSRIDLCHYAQRKGVQIEIEEDVMLYDFHVFVL